MVYSISLVILVFLNELSMFSIVNATNLVCYYSSSAVYLPGQSKFTTDNINATLCTHFVYSYATISSTYQITSSDPANDITNQGYKSFTSLKSKNPQAKFLIALGNKANSTSISQRYSSLVPGNGNIDTLVSSVLVFLETNNFDGVSVDWFFPNSSSDQAIYTSLIASLKTAFRPKGYSLSSTVSAMPATIDVGYNVTAMNANLDLVNLMTFDYSSPFSNTNNAARHPAPLYEDLVNDPTAVNLTGDYSVNYWITRGLSPHLINFGIPFYGISWNLEVYVSSFKSPVKPTSAIRGSGFMGPYSSTPGFLTYYEICNYIDTSTWKIVSETTNLIGPVARTSSAIDNTFVWAGFDDPVMAANKANYVLTKNLGGAMIWDITNDDFTNSCKKGNNPLTTAITAVLNSTFYLTTSTSSTTSTSTVTTSTSSTTSTSTVATSTVSPATLPPTNATTTVKHDSICLSSNHSVVADPTSCYKFYICLNGVAYPSMCREGQYFNETSLRCEEDQRSSCRSKPLEEKNKKSESLSYNAVKYDWKVNY